MGESSTSGLWAKDRAFSQPLASGSEMGDKDGFSLLPSLGSEGAHEQMPPLPSLSHREATLVTCFVPIVCYVEKGLAWSQPLQGKV